ncbi:RBBP9/YdeN family alpha/beta hydrolase [Pseudogemmobacter humi]|uniref:Alpha/beta hydrolase family protein n=1 Tax=Pseudogemmobacter humi TaxID=2483812 RepID=A0A3P5X784_9RHOB|nr:alpha/beta fold hydrolase [Pseudogemmobacter humi]VDC30237.1 Alpha/beta hydrolase family protein [Pseudogemmobacter humi]
MITTLIVPGLDGSPAPHWQHHWAAGDPHALMAGLSDPHRPVAAVWEIELAAMILQHPGCVLVGHSLGAVLIARLLTQWPHLRVAGALLVAPAETAGSDRIGDFGPIPELPLDLPTTVVASRNDPWMSFPRAAQLARAWEAELVDLGFAGHVNVASGYGPWAGGRPLRDALLCARRGPAFAVRSGAGTGPGRVAAS